MRRLIALAFAFSLVACARQIPPPRVSPGSPLAKIQIGMSQNEVKSLLGDPSDSHGHATGKVAIPFYFGNDAGEVVYHYKGLGRIVFAFGVFNQNPAVIRVEDDPRESGFYRQHR